MIANGEVKSNGTGSALSGLRAGMHWYLHHGEKGYIENLVLAVDKLGYGEFESVFNIYTESLNTAVFALLTGTISNAVEGQPIKCECCGENVGLAEVAEIFWEEVYQCDWEGGFTPKDELDRNSFIIGFLEGVLMKHYGVQELDFKKAKKKKPSKRPGNKEALLRSLAHKCGWL